MVEWAKVTKRFVGAALVLGGLGYWAHDRFALSSTYAVVAAPTVDVDAPCDGVFSENVRSFAVLPAGAALGVIKPTPLDDPEQRGAQAELETSRADAASLKRLIDLAEEIRLKVDQRWGQLVQGRRTHLEQLSQQAGRDEAKQQAAAQGATVAEQRALTLCEQNLLSQQECDAARSRAEVARKELEAAEGQKLIASFLMKSGRSDADIGNAVGSEVTYARAQRDDLTMRLAGLKQQLETREAQVSALERRLNPPEIQLVTATPSRVSRMMYGQGARVVKGKPLIQMARCDQLFVFAVVSEVHYQSLRAGMGATVTVDGHAYPGKVAELLGPSTPGGPVDFLPRPPAPLGDRDRGKAGVAVSVPGLQKVLSASCDVGRRVDVRFER